jgi:hypothetical protein
MKENMKILLMWILFVVLMLVGLGVMKGLILSGLTFGYMLGVVALAWVLVKVFMKD